MPKLLKEIKSFDVLYIDGNHSYEATLRYFNLVKEYIKEDTIIVFDDIYWSEGMTKAWLEIKNDSIVSHTIDLFYFGLTFFRKEKDISDYKMRVY